MGVKAPLEMKPARELKSDESEDVCPDSWEMADLEESMKRLMPAGCSLATDGVGTKSSSFGDGDDPMQVDEFLREALQNPHDRMTILRLEQEVEKFVRNPKQQHLEFPPMPSSYLRLAAHRVAQHYSLLTSVIDSSCAEGCRIIVRKGGEIKHPSVRLSDIPVTSEGAGQANTKFVIKQRPQGNFLSNGSGGASSSSSGNNPSKSVEERNEEYNKARARIFRHEIEQKAYDELLEVERTESRKKLAESKDNAEHSGAASGKRNGKLEKDQSGKSRQKVAIFRDREKDRKDPDYDRNYDRYSQRFDPGFGLNQPAFSMQARYTPVVNYNTEFPQLGCPPVRQMPPAGQPVQGWGPYQPQDMLRAPYNPPPRAAPHANMATYMSQYPYPRPSMPYPYSAQVSQPEASSALARRH